MARLKELSEKFEHSKAYGDDISESKKRKAEHDEKVVDVIHKFGDLPIDKKKKKRLAKEKARLQKEEEKMKKEQEKKKKKEEEHKPEEEAERKPHKREIRIRAASVKEEKVQLEQPVKITHPIKTGFLFGIGLLFFMILLIILLYSISIIAGMPVSELLNSLI